MITNTAGCGAAHPSWFSYGGMERVEWGSQTRVTRILRERMLQDLRRSSREPVAEQRQSSGRLS